jgi:hypothetical protein
MGRERRGLYEREKKEREKKKDEGGGWVTGKRDGGARVKI